MRKLSSTEGKIKRGNERTGSVWGAMESGLRHRLPLLATGHVAAYANDAFSPSSAPPASVCWGSWYDHVTGWWNVRERHRILYLFFEDMKEDPMREVSRIARFLERPLSEQQLREVVKLTSFPVMRDNPMTNYSTVPTDFMDHSVSPFMRKGEVGDWRNDFSAAQLEAFEQHYKDKMAATDLCLRDCLP
ncbi:sulfotransferase 1C1-like [Petromyzon marinus]|uniref:sulfotransferase 1C1-like n=1 Tax=Petromyzon marinus TaxID=7757 RepID=UPI003F6F3429